MTGFGTALSQSRSGSLAGLALAFGATWPPSPRSDRLCKGTHIDPWESQVVTL
jgi:hypothetical protein